MTASKQILELDAEDLVLERMTGKSRTAPQRESIGKLDGSAPSDRLLSDTLNSLREAQVRLNSLNLRSGHQLQLVRSDAQNSSGASACDSSEAQRSAAKQGRNETLEGLAAYIAESQTLIESLQAERSLLIDRIVEHKQALTTSEYELASCRGAFDRLAEARDALEEKTESRFRLEMQELESREARFRLKAQRLERAMQRMDVLQSRIAALENSRSWRITSPLRKMAAFFRGLRT